MREKIKQPMTITRLNQYRDLRREVDMLENEVRHLREQASEQISDTVTASAPEWPYVRHTVVVKGTPPMPTKLRRRIRRLKDRRAHLDDELEEIDIWIAHVPDSMTRQIIWMRYLQGLSWQQVATRMGGGNTADGMRKKIERFLLGK